MRRKFWIFKGDSNFCDELIYDIDTGKEVRSRPDGFYDIVSPNDTVEGGIPVTELLDGDVILSREEAEKVKEALKNARHYARLDSDCWIPSDEIAVDEALDLLEKANSPTP